MHQRNRVQFLLRPPLNPSGDCTAVVQYKNFIQTSVQYSAEAGSGAGQPGEDDQFKPAGIYPLQQYVLYSSTALQYSYANLSLLFARYNFVALGWKRHEDEEEDEHEE